MKLKMEKFGPCLKKIEARGRVTNAEAREILQEVADRAEQMRRAGQRDPLVSAVRDLSAKIKDKAAKDRLDAIRNAGIRARAFEQVLDNGGLRNAALSIESRMVHVNSKLKNMEAPAEEVAQGLHFRWLSAIDVQMEKAGLSQAVQSGLLDREISRELFNMSQVGPKRAPEANNFAARAAWIFHRPLFEAAERLKAAGARFDHATEYVVHTSHSPRQMRDAGFDRWWQDEEPRWHERTFEDLTPLDEKETPAEMRKRFALSIYNALITAVHMGSDHLTALSGDDTGYTPPAYEGSRNMAKKFSHQRVIYYKDGDAWHDHMRQYGNMTTLLRTIHDVLGSAANGAALMEKFGTNPMASLNQLVRSVQEHYRNIDPNGVNEFSKKITHLQNVMGRLDGSLNTPINSGWAEMNSTLRTFESASMLGNVGLTHLMSLPATLGSIAPHYGMKRTEVFANLVNSLIKGTSDAEQQEILAEAGAFNHGTVAHFMAQLKTSDTFPGRMSAMAGLFLKATGLNFILELAQNGFRHFQMHHLGRQVDKAFADLHPSLRDLLGHYGIDEKVWDMMRAVGDLKVVEGRRYLTPHDLERIPDAAIDAFKKAEVDKFRQGVEERRVQLHSANAREEEWHNSRVKNVADKIASLQTWVRDKTATRDAAFKERLILGLARIDEAKNRLETLESATDLSQSLKGLGAKDRIQGFLEDVEGGAKSWRAAEKAGRTVEQSARSNLSAGERLGQSRAQVERRIQDLQAKLGEHAELADEKAKSDVEWLNNRIEELHDELTDAQQRMQERIAARDGQLKTLQSPRVADRLAPLSKEAGSLAAERRRIAKQLAETAPGQRARRDTSGGRQAVDDEQARFQNQAELRAGRDVEIPREVVEDAHDALAASAHAIPEGIDSGVLTKISPIKGDKTRYLGTFERLDGSTFTLLLSEPALNSDAMFDRSAGKLVLLRHGKVRGGALRDAASVLRGKVRHELVHAVWGELPTAIRDRLLAHASNFDPLSLSFGDYHRLLGYPDASKSSRYPLRLAYEEAYRGRNNFADLMAQEAVAHYVELYSHGALAADAVAPVKDILEGIVAGKWAGVNGAPKAGYELRQRLGEIDAKNAEIQTRAREIEKADESEKVRDFLERLRQKARWELADNYSAWI